MNSNSLFCLFMMPILVGFSLAACTHHPRENSSLAIQEAKEAEELGAGEYVVVQFPPGKETLGESEKEKIRYLKTLVEGRRSVREIKVLAWSDQEYPSDSQPSLSERQLADQRGRRIKSFLRDELGSKKNVDVHNMAQRPGIFAEVFNSYDYRMKNAAQATEELANDDGIVSENKGSKAVVLVRYE